MDFFPCFLDINKHLPTVAFGYSNSEASKTELLDYFKKTKIAKILPEDRLVDFFDQYMNHYYFIKLFLKWSNWFIYDKDPNTRPDYKETDDDIISQWNKNVFEFYEKYRIAQSIYDRFLYAQLLNDHLWNPKFDPRNPKVQEYNKAKLLVADKKMEDYNRDIGIDHKIIPSAVGRNNLVGLNLEATVINDTLTNINQLKESGDVEALKFEAMRLFHTNMLIECYHTFTDFAPRDRHQHESLIMTKNNIAKLLDEAVSILTMVEYDFNLVALYESTDHCQSSMEYRQLKNFKQFIKDII